MNNRIKELRKNILKITLKEFGLKIGLSTSSISDIENKRVALTERNVKTICQTFNVNEEWLRNGTEPIFIEKDNNNYIKKLVKKYDIGSKEIDIIKKFIDLDENIRNKIVNFMLGVVKENLDKIDENKLLNISKDISKNIGITDEDIVNINSDKTKKDIS